MKNEKMSLQKIKNVLSHVLSREEMKEVMAGSGGEGCLSCNSLYLNRILHCTKNGDLGCICPDGSAMPCNIQ